MMRPPRPALRRPVTIVAAVAATVATRLLLDAAGTTGPVLGLTLDLVAALVAGWVAWSVAREPRDRRSRRAWVALTAFPLVWVLAPLTWLLELPDAVDAVARATAVLLVAASWWYAARAGGTLSRVRLVVDGAIGLASAVVVGWVPLWSRDWGTDGGADAAAAIGLAVAMLGITVLGAGVVLTEMPAGRRVRPMGFVLGTLVIAASDVAWSLDLPPVWAAGWVAYVLAIRTQPGLTPRVRRVPTRGRQVYLPYVLIAPSALSLALASRAGTPSHPQVVAGLAIVALLLVRQHVTLVENDQLVRRLEQTEEMLRHQATHDSLTGLPGRRALVERLAAAARTHERPTQVALAFVDVDHFKQVNDLHGHAAGDAVLIEVARRLERSRDRRVGSFAARLSGDEFALLFTAPIATDCGTLAATLTRELEGPAAVGQTSIAIKVSVGVATAQHPDVLGSDLLHAADVAMYEVKRAGRVQTR